MWRREAETLKFFDFLSTQVENLKADWLSGVFTRPDMSANEIAVSNLAAVENARFATRLIEMDHTDYLTAMEKV